MQIPSDTYTNIAIITRLRGGNLEKYNTAQKNQTITENTKTKKNKSLARSNTFQKLSSSKKPNKNQTKNEKKINNSAKDTLNNEIQYTLFTCLKPSKIMLLSKKPIKGQTINNTLKTPNDLYNFGYSVLKDSSSIFEFDRIYNETHSIDTIYSEQIKIIINNLFQKVSACLFFFGPTDGGKTFLLRGNNGNNEHGILAKSVIDILNYVELYKQVNNDMNKVNNIFTLKFSSYQIYFDKMHDLLSKDINLVKMKYSYENNDNNNIITNFIGLTEKEIRNLQDFILYMKEIELNKNKLIKKLKIDNIKSKNNIIYTIKIEKKKRNNINFESRSEFIIENYSQISFVELAASNIGLLEKLNDINDISVNNNMYTNTKNIFMSISENISALSNKTQPQKEKESILTLSLKNVLKPSSNIIFFNCVIPSEYPLNNSKLALEFCSNLRNQVINPNENKSILLQNNTSSKIILPETDNNNDYIKMNINDFSKNYTDMNNSVQINEYITNSQEVNHKNNYNINSSTIKNQNNNSYIDPSVNNIIQNMNDEQRIKLLRNDNMQKISSSQPILRYPITKQLSKNNNIENSFNLSIDDKRLQTVQQTLNEMNEKSREIVQKNLELRRNSSLINNTSSVNNINNLNTSYIQSPECQKLTQELQTLKSDNIIYKEDIERLTEKNNNLENELLNQRNYIIELESANKKLQEEKSILENKLNNGSYLFYGGEIPSNDQILENAFQQRVLMQNKMKEMENNLNKINEEKKNYEINYRVLENKYSELKTKFDNCQFELNNIKQMHNGELNNIEEKIILLTNEIEKLRSENYNLRQENERKNMDINVINSHKNELIEKLNDQKSNNDFLSKKLFDIEQGYLEMKKEKEYQMYYRMKTDENKKNRTESKNKIVNDLQSKIQNYRKERLNKREEYNDNLEINNFY